jgi:glycine/D-amino acid oxidase-like deaminating enzyme
LSDRSVDVLIVGSGAAGASCAAELRAQGFGLPLDGRRRVLRRRRHAGRDGEQRRT